MKRLVDCIPLLLVVSGITILALSRCAKQVAPVGGPKDTIPPTLISSSPPNYSVNFSSDEVEIEFDEFIQFEKMQQQFISSPPFDEEPNIQLSGKGLQIEFNEPLKDSTTYTLNFGNAIVDFREGNPLRNFKYVFSTGPVLDSMEVVGRVINAKDLLPREDILVMLYEELRDSVPLNQIPDYVSRTNPDGSFSITNVRKDTFKIFALGDKNGNYLYDNIEEPIAFRDSLITFQEQLIEEHDTLYRESNADTLNTSDSLVIDTIIKKRYYGYPAEKVALRLFNEALKVQYLKSAQRKKPQKVDFIFNKTLEDSVNIQLIDSTEHTDWFLKEVSPEKDTVTYWIKDTSIYNNRYLGFEVGYYGLDSLNNEIWITDTLEVGYSFEEGEKQRRDTINLSSNVSNQFDLNRKVTLSHAYPIQSIDTGRICLYKRIEDTILREMDFSLSRSEKYLHQLKLSFGWDSESDYTIEVLPQAIQSIYDVYHDTLKSNFNTRSEEHYGSLIVGTKMLDEDFIMQVVKANNEEEEVIQEKYPEDSEKGTIEFNYLDPGEYMLKLIYDRNGNKEWDTGEYLKHLQPEKVIYYPEKIDVRSNWEYEIEWNVEQSRLLKRERSE
jgi:hypothetical protein